MITGGGRSRERKERRERTTEALQRNRVVMIDSISRKVRDLYPAIPEIAKKLILFVAWAGMMMADWADWLDFV
ncbi:MAG TPA: hypothetical protein VMT62_03690 [Syntrophorhabdaceae bacterium]|nr:hypothetical protein [Syntrophorhabdaceae bacterium]